MKPRLLFVDDERSVLEALARLLHAFATEWIMDFASNADEALVETTRHAYDAIMCDILMPGTDGFEFLRQIRACKQTCDIPVVILTGCEQVELKRRALDLGASDVLNKPVEREDMIARLRSMLRLKANQDMLKQQNAELEKKVEERTQELEDARLNLIWRYGKVAEARDRGTGSHVIRVGLYCRCIAEALGMDRNFVKTLFLTSPLHDIGKVGIPDRILLKPGRLTVKENEIMKTHTTIGAQILQEDSYMQRVFAAWDRHTHYRETLHRDSWQEMAVTIALTHHERWDGTGYPYGIQGNDIPLEARIAGIADVYDALSYSRPYKPGYPGEQVLRIIAQGVGRHFDPEIYEGFRQSLPTIRDIRAMFPNPLADVVRKAS